MPFSPCEPWTAFRPCRCDNQWCEGGGPSDKFFSRLEMNQIVGRGPLTDEMLAALPLLDTYDHGTLPGDYLIQ